MMKRTLFVKANCHTTSLVEDLSKFAKEIASKNRTALSLLRFAKRTLYSYHFTHFKDKQKQLLNEIVEKVSHKHPHYPSSRIADMLSELVNTTVKDAIVINGLKITPGLEIKDKKYLTTRLIQAADSERYIPRHPWLMPLAVLEADKWQVKDMTTNELLNVTKKQAGDFYEYEIASINSILL